MVKGAETNKQAMKLIEAGFECVTEIDGKKYSRNANSALTESTFNRDSFSRFTRAITIN